MPTDPTPDDLAELRAAWTRVNRVLTGTDRVEVYPQTDPVPSMAGWKATNQLEGERAMLHCAMPKLLARLAAADARAEAAAGEPDRPYRLSGHVIGPGPLADWLAEHHDLNERPAVADATTNNLRRIIRHLREQSATEAELADYWSKTHRDAQILDDMRRERDATRAELARRREDEGAMLQALKNCRMYASREYRRTNHEAWTHILRFCESAGVVPSIISRGLPTPNPGESR